MLDLLLNYYNNYPFVFLVIGFVMLIKWADMLVDWASSIAKKFWISSLVIGLTIVAFGTSAPELVVNVMSAFDWKTAMAIWNIVWSNISNIFLILWVTSLIYPILMPHSTVKKEIPFMIFTSILLLLLLLDWSLSRTDAWILWVFFAWFLYYTFSMAKANKKENDKLDKKIDEDEMIKEMSNLKATIFIIVWLVWLVYGWNFIVDSASNIARSFWWSDAFIGLTIVAIGTSLPELAASVTAALKKETDMAIGWIVGSNIFNILWILSATAFVKPLEWYKWMEVDLSIEFIASLLILIFAFTHKKYFLDRKEWVILVISYIWFLLYQSYQVWMFN